MATAKEMTRSQREFAMVVRHVKRRKEALIARLNSKIRVEGECRIWTGAADANGYARLDFRVPGPRRRGETGKHLFIGVHRLFLILRMAQPIPEDVEVGHYYCHNRLCVAHVKPQTRQENLRDRDGRKKEKSRTGVSR